MKPMLRTEGFALPTVIITSLIMLTVLISSVTAVNSITTTLAGQYYNQQAREAAESGLAAARACLRAYSYDPKWTSAPLTPNSNCFGAPNTTPAYIINSGNVRSSFSVASPPPAGAGGTLRLTSTGTVQLVRTSNPSQIWRTYTYTAAENIRYNDLPQIAGGAGWKNSGHNGYMLASTGVLYGWGDNSGYQLGDSSLGTIVSTPVKVTLPDGTSRAKKVFNSGQGASVLCILATHSSLGDQVYCRGLGMGLSGTAWQRVGLGAGLTAIDMSLNGYGADSGCVKASDLQVYCVGLNDSGGLGTGTASNTFVPITAPVKFRLDLASPGPVSGSAASLTVQKVFNQDRTTCVIASDNQAYCAGDNNFGQLGQGNFAINVGTGKSVPGRALVPGNQNVADVVLTYHGAVEGVFLMTENGTVYMAGHNGFGTAGDGGFTENPAGDPGQCAVSNAVNCYPTPRAVTWGGFSKMISIGWQGDNRHGLCIVGIIATSPDSSMWCLGQNSNGELGTGNCTARASLTSYSPVAGEKVNHLMNVESTYQMNSMTVITTAGNAYAAGDNTYGKLGTGGPLQSCNGTFAKVQLPFGVKAMAVANGDEYTTFILGDDGKVYAMGRNNNGQLGNGTTTNSSVPVEVQIPRQETVY